MSQIFQVRWARDAGHCRKSKDKLSDVLWTPTHRHTNIGQPTKIYYIDQLWANSVCCLKDLQRVMTDSEGWWEIVMEICAVSMPWWWYVLLLIHPFSYVIDLLIASRIIPNFNIVVMNFRIFINWQHYPYCKQNYPSKMFTEFFSKIR